MLIDAFPPGRRAALERLAAIRPDRYARTRNFLNGAVTRLSPYLRHGILSLAEVRDAVLARARAPRDAEKLVQELAWRDYYRRVYGAIGTRVWDDLEVLKTGWSVDDYAHDLPDDVRMGATGLTCIDAFTRDLTSTGYVHNHARMYFAAYVVHHRRVRWQAGAAFYLEHLLDGDASSNNLSWQWVASTFAHKPYIFDRANLERYTNGAHCARCPLAQRGCPFDASYAELDARLFPQSRDTDPLEEVGTRVSLGVPADAAPPQSPLDPRVVIWAHTDALSDVTSARAAFPEAPVIFASDDATRTRERWSERRIAFVEGSLAEMKVDARAEHRAPEAVVQFARAHGAQAVVTMSSPDPGLRAIAASIADIMPITSLDTAPFATLDRPTDLRRFSRYWKRAEASAFTITPPA